MKHCLKCPLSLQKIFQILQSATHTLNAAPVLDKLHEEIDEYKQAIANQDKENLFEEVGDLLFTLVNLARKHNIDPEEALRCANLKFETRFRKIENEITKDDTLTMLEEKWQKAKR